MKEIILEHLSSIPGWEYLQNKYLFSLLIILLFAFIGKVVLMIFSKYLEKFASKTKTKVDDMIFEHTKKPIFYLVVVYGLKLSLLNLEVNGIVNNFVNSLMAFVLLLIFLKFFDILLDAWGLAFAKKTKTKIVEILLPLFHKITKTLFIIIAVMWLLKIWGVDITPYLAGVGISGVVLGLALQDSLKNIFGGVTLLLDRTFQVGDKVKLEDGTVGTIHDIGLRSTKMATYSNEIIYLPNGYLANSRIQNYTRPNPKVRVDVNFGVAYGVNIDKVKKIVLDEISKMKDVLDNPGPSVEFLEMGDSALSFVAKFWVPKWDQSYGKKLEATQKIYEILGKAGIEIPFPTRTVYMKK